MAIELSAQESAPPLILAPVLSYFSYLGGSGFDFASGVAVDPAGNLYATGYTNSADFPLLNAAQGTRGGGTCGAGLDTYPCFDVFVAKFDPSGRSLIYASYFGGSGDDFGAAIAVDAAGNAYVAGYTDSLDLPVANAFQSRPGGGTCDTLACFDAFVVKLEASGANFGFATYLGGSSDDFAQGIAVDASGSVTVTGFTASTDFPVHRAIHGSFGGGGHDAFVARLDPSGQAVFSTFLGGAGDDQGTSVTVDAAGDLYLAGFTNSADFPTAMAAQSAYAGGTCGALSSTFDCFDAYVAKLQRDGAQFAYATYLGGTGSDYAHGIAVDSAGSAYVTGLTTSQDFPVTWGSFQIAGGGSNTDAFVAKLDPQGSSLVYSTYLGGIGAERGAAVAVDAAGRAHVAGYAYGQGLPLVNPVQPANAGFYDASVTTLSAAGTALEFATYLGGSGNEQARAVALDRNGTVYIVGETFSADLPTTRAFQPSYAGGSFDAFVAGLAWGDSAGVHLSPSRLDFRPQRVGTASPSQSLTLTNLAGHPLTVASVDITGDFTQSSGCVASLDPGAGCQVAVAFVPTAAGPRTGALTIAVDDPAAVYSVALSGTGIASAIALSPSSLDFGPQLVGTQSPPQTVTLTNTGTDFLEVSGISIPGEFAGDHDCLGPIAVDASCSIHLRFVPASSGDRVGTLTVTNSQPEEASTASLSGRGTDFTLASSAAEIPLKAGEKANFTLTVNPAGGFSGTVALACAGAPAAAECSIAPASVTLDGLNPASAIVTVSTTARAMTGPRAPSPWGLWGQLAVTLLGLLTIVMIAARSRRAMPEFCVKRVRLAMVSAILLLPTVLWTACGGGGGTTSHAPPRGTPAGTYTLTLTGTLDGVDRSVAVKLKVT
jgi:hypothetical protein